MLVFRHLLERAGSRAERLALLCAKLEDVFMTVFRQVANYRFEDAVHNARRSEGELGPERISSIWIETQSAMFGRSVRLLGHYRIWWSYVPHFIHWPGYVYAYAFGQLLVLALYRQYRQRGAEFTPAYLEFLAAGGKARPDELLAPFGIDLTGPGFWRDGLGIIEDLLNEAEREAA
jgi:oligoendopeptidase F